MALGDGECRNSGENGGSEHTECAHGVTPLTGTVRASGLALTGGRSELSGRVYGRDARRNHGLLMWGDEVRRAGCATMRS